MGGLGAGVLYHNATKSRFDLSFRTSLERNAPESLTLVLYGFVHGDIWLRFR